ncbi:MAG: alanyl-tRNA editing protein [Lachnospiraceae bacterium]|nr:alanyl-tRNA editing protein [Lachnospiraceae bacterium]
MDERKLFYINPYIREFNAVVAEAGEEKGRPYAVLSQTAFYPEGGGQPCDLGVLIIPNGKAVDKEEVPEKNEAEHDDKRGYSRMTEEYRMFLHAMHNGGDPGVRAIKVIDVHERNGEIRHYLSESIPVGTRTHGIIDWDRRFDHMQQHSGEHIVSGMICKRFFCDNVGFHMGKDTITIDYNAEISFEEALRIEDEANRYIRENHPIDISWPTEEERELIDYRSKKALSGDVRIVAFPGADCCACCGTHVRCSAEVSMVKFISASKFHDGTRLELLCGQRAVKYLSDCWTQNKAVGVLLHAKETETAEIVTKLHDEMAETKVRLARMEEAWFKEISEKYRGEKDVLLVTEPLTGDGVRKLAVLIGEACEGRAAVFAGEGSDYKYAVVSNGEQAMPFVKEMNAALNGRGGGRDSFAQGSVKATEKEIRAYFSN